MKVATSMLTLGSTITVWATSAWAAAVDVPAGVEKGVLDIILDKGITGAMLVIMLLAYIRKDKALDEEKAARINDQKEFSKTRQDDANKAKEDAEEYARSMRDQLVTTSTIATQSSATSAKVLEVFTRFEQREQVNAAVAAQQQQQRRESNDDDEPRARGGVPRPRRPGSIARDE